MEVRKIAKKTITVIEPKQALLVDKAKYQDKVRTGSPFPENMKEIIKRRKEQHDQLKNQNERR